MSIDLGFSVREYQSGTLAKRVRGTLYNHDPQHRLFALEELASGMPLGTVLIPDTLHLSTYFAILDNPEPHPECNALHKVPEPAWWTDITARAFPDVDPEHMRVVALIGKTNHIVRVPLIRPLTAHWMEAE